LKRNTTVAKKNNNSPNVNNDYDERMMQLLMEYKIKHGDVHVPTGNTPLIKNGNNQIYLMN
jgi:hypothetical protein